MLTRMLEVRLKPPNRIGKSVAVSVSEILLWSVNFAAQPQCRSCEENDVVRWETSQSQIKRSKRTRTLIDRTMLLHQVIA
jgi:hypothetical protein